MSNSPSTMPSLWGVGPITVGPWGEEKPSSGSIFSGASSSARFLFIGVVVSWSFEALGVRSTSLFDTGLGVRLDGVRGAVVLDSRALSLLYSLYFCAA